MLLGMTKLLSLFAYRDLFREPHKLVDSHLEMYHPYGSDTEETELLLELSGPVRFPSPFLYQGDLCSLHCKDSSGETCDSGIYRNIKILFMTITKTIIICRKKILPFIKVSLLL